jgi:hypothetical protein
MTFERKIWVLSTKWNGFISPRSAEDLVHVHCIWLLSSAFTLTTAVPCHTSWRKQSSKVDVSWHMPLRLSTGGCCLITLKWGEFRLIWFLNRICKALKGDNFLHCYSLFSSNISTEDMLYTESDIENSMDKIETLNFHQVLHSHLLSWNMKIFVIKLK